MTAKSGPLEKKVTLRMDDDLWETLKIMSKKDKKLNQSQMVREALQLWINLRINREFYPDSDLCVISLNMLRLALTSMDDKELKQMSQIAFNNSKMSMENFRKLFGGLKNFQSRMESTKDLNGRLASMVGSVYGPTGYRWFDEIRYTQEKEKVIIKGTHRLGNNFTQFFRHHVSNNLDEFNYEMDSMQVSFIERKDNTREDHVELVFLKVMPN